MLKGQFSFNEAHLRFQVILALLEWSIPILYHLYEAGHAILVLIPVNQGRLRTCIF